MKVLSPPWKVPSRDFCPYARAFLRQYNDNHVVAVAESCDAMRRVYDALRYWDLAGGVHFVDVPRTYDPEAVSFYADELRTFASNLTDSKRLPLPTSGNLKTVIGGMNRIRIGLAEVFNFLSKDRFPLSQQLSLPCLLTGSG